MNLPFTQSQFLDVFAAYNAVLWGPAALLWLLSLAALGAALRGSAPRAVAGVLALHWAWSGAAYHWAFFAAINPAAKLFGAAFVLQALLFAGAAAGKPRLRFGWQPTPLRVLGLTLALYGLAYPLLSSVLVHAFPRTPSFGVPCPTTLFTAGLLLLARPLPWWLVVIPVLWSAVGGSAAVLLGMPTDYALIVAGAAMVVGAWAARRG